MNLDKKIESSIQQASAYVATTWPLYHFVTSNPLSGYEHLPFEQAVAKMHQHMGANGYPSPSFFRQAWENEQIDKHIITEVLEQNLLFQAPEYYLTEMEAWGKTDWQNPKHQLDRLVVKWLSAFVDEGLAEWPMPYKEKGFYHAWKTLAYLDTDISNRKALKKLPEDPLEAIQSVIEGFSIENYEDIFQYHLNALPGWTGFIKFRMDQNTEIQQSHPITLTDYLAVRLLLAQVTGHAILPHHQPRLDPSKTKLQKIWLTAWEKTWQRSLFKTIGDAAKKQVKSTSGLPESQLVFCIDTRSELIRKHIEAQGNFETFGYAGFFGIPMEYQPYNSELQNTSCPPIVPPAYLVNEQVEANRANLKTGFLNKEAFRKGLKGFLLKLKNMLPASLGFVEGAGSFYGLTMLTRTITPKMWKKKPVSYETFCTPTIINKETGEPISLGEQVNLVKGAFDLMGWKDFAPIVAFVGHGSHTSNNPFASSLDCGACAASPGRNNARMLAQLANLPAVRQQLKKQYNIAIPSSTYFVGGEHNTTTDEIVLFDYDAPSTHHKQLAQLKKSFRLAQETATFERLNSNNSVGKAYEKAFNWAETRPEWGLAKNAGFVVAPRSLTKDLNLESRCFMHSYDWQKDPEGAALEGIMKGPMVVTQWINNHYYFATIDNDNFGSGSKITHNIAGKFGVVQGNGGDLKRGLPLQSLFADDDTLYHEPLRLTVLIQAPKSRVNEILAKNKDLKDLIDNQWIYLAVMDPKHNNTISLYDKQEIENNHHMVKTSNGVAMEM